MSTCVVAALSGVVLGAAIGAGVPAQTVLKLLRGNGKAAKLDRILDALTEQSGQAEEPDP